MKEDYARLYKTMHANDKAFRGRSIKAAVPMICQCVERYKPRTLLDYGCGKGRQYTEDQVHEQWGGLMPTLYDVGVPEYSKHPDGPFDGIICTDVMEHIAEHDVDDVLIDLFSMIKPRDDLGVSFVVFYIACRLAKKKTLPDGRNVHLTVRDPKWWATKISWHAAYHGALVDVRMDFDGDGL